jgi:hypothetical protein
LICQSLLQWFKAQIAWKEYHDAQRKAEKQPSNQYAQVFLCLFALRSKLCCTQTCSLAHLSRFDSCIFVS